MAQNDKMYICTVSKSGVCPDFETQRNKRKNKNNNNNCHPLTIHLIVLIQKMYSSPLSRVFIFMFLLKPFFCFYFIGFRQGCGAAHSCHYNANPDSSNLVSSIPINSIDDLKGKSVEEIWDIFKILRNHNIALEKKIHQLNGTIIRKDDEIFIFKGEPSDIVTLQNKVASVFNTNNELIKRIADMEKINLEMEKVNLELKSDYSKLKKDSTELKNHNDKMIGLMLQKFEGMEKKLQKFEDMEKDYAEMKSNNKEMLERFEGMEKSLATIKESLSAREIGIQADRVAIKRVFAAASKYPFSIRSFSNLNKLINDPKKAPGLSVGSSEAAAAWLAMDKHQRDLIVQKRDELIEQFPNLIDSIKRLKDQWPVAHNITSVTGSIEHFRRVGDKDMVSALEECSNLLE